ncbi:unnamed protein product [Ambrosiozyma monospora]|uniref:Unnamed protein product n=1 Tax=Ambrosiozyma monospora TaxID=43982 RepID=A0ACB5T316_AMBMO|nr:unnamed protein product [Ambrosiozyma monospora]
MNHVEKSKESGDGLAVLLKLRLLQSREPINEYELALEWRQTMHRFPNILEEQPCVYDFSIERYTFLLSQIRKYPLVGFYLSEKEVTEHCLKSFLSSRHTKSVTQLLQLRGVSSQSFQRFNDMKEELLEAIQRSAKHQMMLKGHGQRAYMAKYYVQKNTETTSKRTPVPATDTLPGHRPTPTQIRAHVPAPTRTSVHVPAQTKAETPVPDKVIANKKQGSPATKSPAPKKAEAHRKTEHKSKSPKPEKSNRKEPKYLTDKEIKSRAQKILPSTPYDTILDRAAGKQPLTPVLTIVETHKEETKKTSAIPSDILSIVMRSVLVVILVGLLGLISLTHLSIVLKHCWVVCDQRSNLIRIYIFPFNPFDQYRFQFLVVFIHS